jgi:hypothetical protein
MKDSSQLTQTEKDHKKINYSTVEINEEFIEKNREYIDYDNCKIIQYFLKTKEDCIPVNSPEHFCNIFKSKIRNNQFYYLQDYIYYQTTRTDIEYIFKPDTTVYTIEYRMDKFAMHEKEYIIKHAPIKAKGRIYFKDNRLVLENIIGDGLQIVNKKIDKIRCEVWNLHSENFHKFIKGFVYLENNIIELNLDKPYHKTSEIWIDLTKD